MTEQTIPAEPETIEAPALCEHAGISYRQLDHWTRRGYLQTVGEQTPGSGQSRVWPVREASIAETMHTLIECGFTPHAAADYARQYHVDVWSPVDGLVSAALGIVSSDRLGL